MPCPGNARGNHGYKRTFWLFKNSSISHLKRTKIDVSGRCHAVSLAATGAINFCLPHSTTAA